MDIPFNEFSSRVLSKCHKYKAQRYQKLHPKLILIILLRGMTARHSKLSITLSLKVVALIEFRKTMLYSLYITMPYNLLF